jgi:hypothetical protein
MGTAGVVGAEGSRGPQAARAAMVKESASKEYGLIIAAKLACADRVV